MGRAAIKGVLDNFLGTYASRYSDYNGYWLFGFLVADLGELKIDLLNLRKVSFENSPSTKAVKIAEQKFQEQMQKARVSLSSLQEAGITVSKLGDTKTGPVNGRICSGSTVCLKARAVLKTGRVIEREVSMFVAPHDPNVELRCIAR